MTWWLLGAFMLGAFMLGMLAGSILTYWRLALPWRRQLEDIASRIDP